MALALASVALIGLFAIALTSMILRYQRDARGIMRGSDRKRLEELENRFDRDYR